MHEDARRQVLRKPWFVHAEGPESLADATPA